MKRKLGIDSLTHGVIEPWICP